MSSYMLYKISNLYKIYNISDILYMLYKISNLYKIYNISDILYKISDI